MAYRDFVNDSKKGILKDVMLFYGAEDYLMNWAAESIISEYVDEASRDLDVIRLEGDQTTASDIMAAARAYSMFSDKRVVVVRNYLPLYRKTADAAEDELLSFVSSPQDQSIVIFMLESRVSGDLTAYGSVGRPDRIREEARQGVRRL